jgi:hypothetical protein
VYSKPQFLGIWYDQFYFSTDEVFWKVHDGRRVIYKWNNK